MKGKILCILCLICAVFQSAKGQNIINKTEIQSPPISLQTQLMNERISELMADRVTNNKGIAIRELASIDDMIFEDLDDLLEMESMMFPADELYGYWDTNRVNPYGNREIVYPDTFAVDCSTFILPIDIDIKITSVFGVRGRRMHNGIDLKVQIGDTIRAAFSGKIRIKGYERRGYGYYLVIRHSNGLETVYGHLSKFLVGDNEVVTAGQPIGLGGNTGRSTGSHLHFETRFLGQALNPSHIIDFNNGGVPHNDQYVLYKGSFGKNVNIYTSTSEQIVYHRVKSGETLSKIAQMYKTSVSELCRLNGLTAKSTLRVGQAIRCGTTIAKSVKKEAEVVASQNEDATATERTVSAAITSVPAAGNTAASTETATKAEQKEAAQPVYYRIKEGDTLGAIALKYGISINKLCELNNITRTTILRIGRSLRCS